MRSSAANLWTPPLDPPWATRVRHVSQECVPCAFCGVLAIEACPGVKDSDAWGDEWTYPVCIKESSAGWKVWAPHLYMYLWAEDRQSTPWMQPAAQ